MTQPDDTTRGPAELEGARSAPLPDGLYPQLPTRHDTPPTGDQWLHEIKFDGYRLLAYLDAGQVRLQTRNGHLWTDRFPRLAEALAGLQADTAVVDGEVVALGARGIPDFQALQKAIAERRDDRLHFYAFDLLYCDGYDLRRVGLERRKALLRERMGGLADTVRYTQHVDAPGKTVFEQACQLGAEGIVSKRRDGGYVHRRSEGWIKTKCVEQLDFAIVGFTPGSSGRAGFGSLVLALWVDDRLRYAGRVGSGFTDQDLQTLRKRLEALTIDAPAFDLGQASVPSGTQWVRPELVCEVEFTERTKSGAVRHPVFRGVRDDLTPQDATLEAADAPPADIQEQTMPHSEAASSADAPPTVAAVRLSSPDRILYPEVGVDKREVAEYYAAVAEWMLPHVADRPLSLVRCPNGIDHDCFFQKHIADTFPEVVGRVPVEESEGEERLYGYVDSPEALVAMAQMNVLEIHPWPARRDRLDRPDYYVFDLDPGKGVAWEDIVEGTRHVRALLEELGLASYLRTTGGKGLHVVVPITRRHDWDEFKTFARAIADEMARRQPERFTANMSKDKRRGKIFLDYLRNGRGATAIANFSTRARPGAPVAVPLRWEELSVGLRSDHYTVRNVRRRLAALDADPWKGYFEVRQSITKDIRQALGMER